MSVSLKIDATIAVNCPIKINKTDNFAQASTLLFPNEKNGTVGFHKNEIAAKIKCDDPEKVIF